MEMTSSARGRSYFPLHSSGWNDFVCARRKLGMTCFPHRLKIMKPVKLVKIMELTSSARGRSHFHCILAGGMTSSARDRNGGSPGFSPHRLKIMKPVKIVKIMEMTSSARGRSHFSLHSSGWNDFVCARQEREITGFLFPSGVGGTRKQFVSKGVLCGYPLDSGIPRPGGDLETSPPSIPRGIFFPSNRFVSFPRRSISSKGFKP